MKLHKHLAALELSKILDRLADLTCCEDAARLARSLTPMTDPDEVRAEIGKTEAALSLTARYGSPRFIRMVSPQGSCKRAAAGGVLSPRALLDIAAVLCQGRMLEEWRDSFEQMPPELSDLFDRVYANRYLEQRITAALISEEEVADDASPELAQIRRKIRNTEQKAREHLEKILRSPTYQKVLQENLVTQRDGRFVVPVKAEQRAALPGLVHDTSGSGSTLFVEPMSVVEANNRIRELAVEEQEEIRRILAELSEETALYGEAIMSGYQTAVALNLCFSKAQLAAIMQATAPEIRSDGSILLKKARHPLIPPEQAVPIDLSLGEDFKLLVITGPNTGGKTVSLKTVGLLTLMAMCGMMIPAADGSRISVFDQVLADIGDEQSIEQSLSTFSAHMTNIVSILSKANSRTLVLIDELGSGTDPVEGAALAVAVLEHLRRLGAKVAATTHYAELKVYALRTEGVENASCEFDVATLRPTYRLLLGVPGRSNAFAISKRLGLADSVLEEARALVAGESRRFEDVVEQLEETRRQLEAERSELIRAKAAAEEEADRLRAERQKQEEALKLERRRAEEEAHRLVEDVRTRAERLMDELMALKREKDKEDFSQKTSDARSGLRGRLRRLEDMASPVERSLPQEEYTLPRPLKKGDSVLFTDLNREATVLSVSDGSGKVEIQAGAMRMRAPLDRLRLIDKGKKNPTGGRTVRSTESRATREVSLELDLRGMTAEEALLDLDRFLDSAVLSGVTQVTVIHGKGTGVLRKAVQGHLKGHPHVRDYRLGVYGEGEAGVTVVTLR